MIFLLFGLSSQNAVVPNTADLEFTIPHNKMEFTVQNDSMEFTVPSNKMKFTIEYDGMDFSIPSNKLHYEIEE